MALALARRGATVIVAARREERLQELLEEMGPGDHSYVVCDVSNLDSVRRMAAAVAERTDHLDLLVNNAGRPGPGPIASASPEEVEEVVTTNLLGGIWCIQLLGTLIDAAPRTDRLPAIVNVASMSGRIPLAGAATYTASKFGFVGFSEALWSEMRNRGIHVMVVNPGLVDTEGFPMHVAHSVPLLRRTVMTPDRVAEALCRGVETGRFEVRVQGWWHLVYYFMFFLGPLRRRLMRHLMGLVSRAITKEGRR